MERLEQRVTELEKDMDGLCTDVKLIMENHLPHIREDLRELSTMLKIYGTIIMGAILALIGVVVSQ